AATFNAQNPACYGESTGAIVAVPTGGNEPYTFLWSNGATTAANTGLGAGVYLVTITDANNCEFTAAQTLDNPVQLTGSITEINHPHQGLNDGSVSIEVSGGTGVLNYVWTLGGQAVSFSQNLLNAAPGDYVLLITDENGCNLIFNVTLTETVGAVQPGAAFFAEVMPNPAQDKAMLNVRLSAAADMSLSLSDGQGRNLREWSVGMQQNGHIPLDFSELPAGMYWLKIVAGQDTAVRRVVVSR
ncbi:MAG TPA: T9SS type A sorting domain-containing protein, partial [Saprospiraceae bacterium]|nr:T9SS type A sorting domain-containing protein [Saprospiraceae bacterium]